MVLSSAGSESSVRQVIMVEGPWGTGDCTLHSYRSLEQLTAWCAGCRVEPSKARTALKDPFPVTHFL